VRLYLELARRGYRRWAAYPAATAAGVFTNSIFGFIRGYVLLALFEHRDDVGGYDAAETLTYVWVSQALIAGVFIFSWNELALRIRSGDVVTDLTRPLDLQLAGLAADLGRSVYHFVFRGIPPLVVGALAFTLELPADPVVWLAFVLSAFLAVCLSYAFRFLYNIAAFWTVDWRGPVIVSVLLVSFFSGFLVPVRFFPDWLAAVAHALPFWAMIQLPIDILVGEAQGLDALAALALQAFWIVVLLGLGRLALAAALHRLVVQGG
jgi:ABC-2 type transport system permease protein